MTVQFSKKFVKQLAKQPQKVQNSFYKRLDIFLDDPNDPLLRNHSLQGKLKGFYGINVTGDVRAIYEIIDEEMFLYSMIGTHSQLYE